MEAVFLKLINMSITASWLILAVLCIRLLFKRIPKWVNCLMWGVVAVRLICPFSLESIWSLQPSSEPVKSSTVVEGEIVSYVPSIDSSIPVVEKTINPILTQTFQYEASESVAPWQVFTYVAGIVWCLGMILLLGIALISLIRLRLEVREGIRYQERIYLCDAVKSPFILGLINPRIYLPSSLEEAEKGYIIAHEYAHLKRKDHWWKPFGYLLLCVYWFNPLCWIAYIMLCKDIELACDEKVIKDMPFQEKKEYSRILLGCATQRRLVMACPLAFGEVGVKERVKSVLHYKKPKFWILLMSLVACIVVAVCFLTNPHKEYRIRVTIPAGSTEGVCYSDEEISPKKNTLTLQVDEECGETEICLKPVEVQEENAYELMAVSPEKPIKMKVERGAWFKIGIRVQNPATEDLNLYVTVKNVEVRIADKQEDKEESLLKQERRNPGRDESAIQDYLSTFAQETADILTQGNAFYAGWQNAQNPQPWEEFLASVKKGEEASVVVMTTTDEGDPILYYIHYDGTDYLVVWDTHRDHFGTPVYVTDKFRCMSEIRDKENNSYLVYFANEPLRTIEEANACWEEYNRLYEAGEIDLNAPYEYQLCPICVIATSWEQSEDSQTPMDPPLGIISFADADGVVSCVCDINNDGELENVFADYADALSDSQEIFEIKIADKAGKVLWSDILGLPHLGWRSFYIVMVDDIPHILEYFPPEESQGMLYYAYKVFRLDKNGNVVVLDERSGKTEAELDAFLTAAGEYLDKATLLISTWDFELKHFQEGNTTTGDEELSGDTYSEKISWADLDGNGVEEYILIEQGDYLGQNVVNGRITMYVNDKPVYQYTEELPIVGVADKVYVDLDGDGEREIFFFFEPAVNSRPLMEYIVLKKKGENWEPLEMPHGSSMLDNGFPITVTYGKKENTIEIACDGYSESISYDIKAFYEHLIRQEKEWGNDGRIYEDILENNMFRGGDAFGGTIPWGIWELSWATYGGENCLIATHGIQGPVGQADFLGHVDIYFNYDNKGKVKILNMEFREEYKEETMKLE